MAGFVATLVRRLLAEDREQVQGGLSRNRHFEVFADPQGQRAHRLYRRLRALLHDIFAADPARPTLERRSGSGDRPFLLRIPLPGGERRAYLTEEELAILKDTPGLDERLAG